MDDKQEKDSADVGGTEIQTQQGEYHGEGKGLIGKKVRKKDGKRQTPGDVEDYDPETKLYKVRFEADRLDEIKWEELKNYLPQQEIRLKRFPQKKKEAAAGSVEGAKPGNEYAAKPESSLEHKIESLVKEEKSMEEVVKTPPRGDAEEATDISVKVEEPKQDDKPVENTVSSQEGTVERASDEKDSTVHQEFREEISVLEAVVTTVAAESIAVVSAEVVGTQTEIKKDDTKDEGEKHEQEEHEQEEEGAKTEEKVDEVAEAQEERGVQEGEVQQGGIDINEGQHESKSENGEPKETMSSERDAEEREGEGKETNETEEQVKRDEDSEGSLDESDLERLTKKRKRKRKHVLTMQKWKGYKKKRKLAAEKKTLDDAKAKDEEDVNHIKRLVDEMEVIPRRKSRTRKLTEVDEIQKKRQKIAQELKNKLKATTPIAATPLATKKNDEADKQIVSAEEQTPQTEAKDAKSKSSEDAKPSPFDRGIKLRGRKLRKNFNGKVFRGEIADYDRRTRYYKIKYEDGDEEKLMWKDVGPMLVPFEELHTWDDPDSEPQIRILSSDHLLEPDKKKPSKETKKPKLPSLKPLVVKKGRR